MIVMQNEELNLYIIEAMNYKYEKNYLVIYGLQSEIVETKEKAFELFNQNLNHALTCEGIL